MRIFTFAVVRVVALAVVSLHSKVDSFELIVEEMGKGRGMFEVCLLWSSGTQIIVSK